MIIQKNLCSLRYNNEEDWNPKYPKQYLVKDFGEILEGKWKIDRLDDIVHLIIISGLIFIVINFLFLILISLILVSFIFISIICKGNGDEDGGET